MLITETTRHPETAGRGNLGYRTAGWQSGTLHLSSEAATGTKTHCVSQRITEMVSYLLVTLHTASNDS